MTSDQIRRCFRVLGKLIHYGRTADAQADVHRQLLSATIDQTTSGLASDADLVAKFCPPTIQQMNGTIIALDGGPAGAKTLGATLLQQVVAVDLGLKAGAKLALIGPQLVSAMDAAGESVSPSGVGGANADGFAIYFATNYGIELPQDDPSTIDDAWITNTVIPWTRPNTAPGSATAA